MNDSSFIFSRVEDFDSFVACLEKSGFAILSPFVEDVSLFRKKCDSYFRTHSTSEMKATDVLGDEYFSKLLIDPRLLKLYEQLFGDSPVLYPNVTIRKEAYTSWHIDRGFVRTHKYTRNLNLSAFQFGVYAQTGGEPGNGELEVREGSHNLLKRCPFTTTALIDIYTYALALAFKAMVLSSCKPGDLIVWDRRLFHRAARSSKAKSEDVVKYALYWSMSSDDKTHEKRYLEHLCRRSNRSYNFASNHADIRRYAELLNFDFLEAFEGTVRPDVFNLLSQKKLRLGQL